MKLLVFDVDGTLIPNENDLLDDETIKILNKRLEDGDIIAIASGRPYLGIKKYLDQLTNGKKFIIGANGAVVYDYDGNILHFKGLKIKDYNIFYKKYHKLLEDRGCSVYCYTMNKVGYYKLSKVIETESSFNGDLGLVNFNELKFDDDDNILKIMIAGEIEKIEDIDFSYEKDLYHYVDSNDYYHEFVNKKTDKAEGVNFLINYLNINRNDCYCFGDGMNDYEMIKRFNGIAMSNAREEVKSVSKFITLSVNEHGVNYALQNYIK